MLNNPIDWDVISTDPTTQSLRELLGEELLAKLSVDLGGGWIYITANPSENSPIVESIGMLAAKKLGDAYGGHRFTIPLRPGTEWLIKQDLNAGMPVVRIARKYRISAGSIRRLNARVKKQKKPLLEQCRCGNRVHQHES